MGIHIIKQKQAVFWYFPVLFINMARSIRRHNKYNIELIMGLINLLFWPIGYFMPHRKITIGTN